MKTHKEDEPNNPSNAEEVKGRSIPAVVRQQDPRNCVCRDVSNLKCGTTKSYQRQLLNH